MQRSLLRYADELDNQMRMSSDGFSGPDQRWLGWTKALRDVVGI
jgi:hypothetical protein